MHRFIFTCLAIGILSSACTDSTSEKKLTLTGSSTVAPVAVEIAKVFEQKHPGVRIEVQSGGSSRGIADANSGQADIGMVSRALKPEEEGLVPHMIAVDGVAVILHSDNKVNAVTKDQLIDIYTGKITNWSALGGSDRKVVVVNKAAGRATLEVFMDFLKIDAADVKADLIVGENQQAIKTVAGNADAIGYVSIGAAETEAKSGTPIHMPTIDGIAASSATVANGSFPVSRPLQLITKGDASGLAKEFIDFARSQESHPLILSQLYVPIGK